MLNPNIFKKVNLLSLGVYIPNLRLDSSELVNNWQHSPQITNSLGVKQKSVANFDEDPLTMAVMASHRALKDSQIDPKSIGAVFVGSESHPYAVKPTSSMLGWWLGLGHDYLAFDTEFACKAATSALIAAASMVESGFIENALVVGSDKAQSKPGDVLEFAAASAAVAVIIGKRKGVAKLKAVNSYTSDTGDFWRRDNAEFPEHGGRFTGEPGYFLHIESAIQRFLEKYMRKISDFDKIVLHMPNAKFPKKLARKMHITEEQIKDSLTVSYIGNPYSASALLGLANSLSKSEIGEKLLLASYGSGSGSDVLSWEIDKNNYLKDFFEWQWQQGKKISYFDYLNNYNFIK